MSKKTIYLDNAATTKPNLSAIEATIPYMKDKWYNPSSLYQEAKQVQNDIRLARKAIAESIGAKEDEIYFTSSGSESNSWAIQGFIHYWISKGFKPVIITSIIEHKSIIECVEKLCVETHFVGVDNRGLVDKVQLKSLLDHTIRDTKNVKILVSIQAANNEIGTMQDIVGIAELAHKFSAYFHTDAVQMIGRVPTRVNDWGIDMLSASSHKWGGLKGNGFLYIKNGIKILPLIYGTQNNGMRGGTENVIGIVNMAYALTQCNTSKRMIDSKYAMRDYIIDKLKNLPYKIEFNNWVGYVAVLPTIISVTVKERITAEGLLYLLNSSGICVSSGSACNSYSNEPSYVLKAIGLSDDDAIRTLRISFDETTTFEQVDKLIDELNKAIKILIS
jgi:cysteine desulfurase